MRLLVVFIACLFVVVQTAPANARPEHPGAAVHRAMARQGPIITPQEHAMMRAKCGLPAGTAPLRNTRLENGALECPNGRTVRDDETVAMSRRIGKRAHAYADAAVNNPDVKRAIALYADEKTREALRRVHRRPSGTATDRWRAVGGGGHSGVGDAARRRPQTQLPPGRPPRRALAGPRQPSRRPQPGRAALLRPPAEPVLAIDEPGRSAATSPALAYEDRLVALQDAGIALWDVVAHARRPGSTDAAIADAEANDLAALLATLPNLRAIAFNGATAHRHGLKALGTLASRYQIVALPSSSPLHTVGIPVKQPAWSALRDYLE